MIKYKKHLNILIDDQLLERMENNIVDKEIKLSQFVRMAIREKLDRMEKENPKDKVVVGGFEFPEDCPLKDL